METTEGLERHMREVLHGDDDQAAGFTATQVIAKGRHRRRARTATFSGVALVAAGAVAVVPSVLVGGHAPGRAGVVSAAGSPVLVATSASHPASAPAPQVSSSGVPDARVVNPGTIDLGGGYALTLTADSLTVSGHSDQAGPDYTDNGNQAPDSISIRNCGPVIAGLYIGKGEAASGTVTVDGKAYPAQVVTLAGHPGWSVAYVVLPTPPSKTTKMSIAVSDAAGHQLASYTPSVHR